MIRRTRSTWPLLVVTLLACASSPARSQQFVSGIVTDAETGEMVKHFRVVPGGYPGGSHLALYHNRAQEFRDGHYIFGEPNPPFHTDKPVVRIEADGYAPATSPPLEDGKDVEFDAQLKRAPNITARVLTPEGEPANGAEVLMASTFTQVSLKNERYDDEAFNYCPRTTTDADGRFVFWPVDEDFRVLVLHEAGTIELTRDELKLLDPLVLQPWSKITGVLRIGPNTAPKGEQVSITSSGTPDFEKPHFNRHYEVRTDDRGRFEFHRLHAGSAYVGRYIETFKSGGYSGWSLTDHRHVELEPGQTVHIELGGKGRPVIGRFELPGNEVRGGWHMNATLSTKPAPVEPLKIPEDVRAQGDEKVREWLEAYYRTDEHKAKQAAIERDRETHRHYAFRVAKDGRFRIDDVVAGTYDLRLRIDTVSDEDQRVTDLGQAHKEITVPPMPTGRSDEPLDVGTIEVEIKEPR